MSREYRFDHRWTLPLPADRLFDVLVDVAGYPAWWPQVRAVARVDEDTAHVVARSRLPYALDLQLTRVVQDRASGVLEARLGGRLEGWARWTLTPVGTATTVRYEQEVVVHGLLMSLGSRVARPLLEANHDAMMRGARDGLLSRGREPGGSSAR